MASVDATVPVSEIRTVDQLLSRSVAASRFTTLLLATFAAVALALAAIGIYGVLSYAVSRRAREIGVRIALGARRVDVLRMVLGHAVLLAGLGALAGVGAALATTRVLETLLFGTSPTDIATFAAGAGVARGRRRRRRVRPRQPGDAGGSDDRAAPGVRRAVSGAGAQAWSQLG